MDSSDVTSYLVKVSNKLLVACRDFIFDYDYDYYDDFREIVYEFHPRLTQLVLEEKVLDYDQQLLFDTISECLNSWKSTLDDSKTDYYGDCHFIRHLNKLTVIINQLELIVDDIVYKNKQE